MSSNFGTSSMAHLTPLALQLTKPSPSNIDDITFGCSNFFKINCPSKWLAEEYIKIDSTFGTYLDTLKLIGKKKSSISAFCTNLYRYYESSDGQKQLKLLKRQRSTLLSKEIAKSSTHGGVYDDIDYDNDGGRNAPWSDNQTSAELNEEAVTNSSSSSKHYTMKETAQVGQKHPHDRLDDNIGVKAKTLQKRGVVSLSFSNTIQGDVSSESDGDDNDGDIVELPFVAATSQFDDLVAKLFRIYNHHTPGVVAMPPPPSGTLKDLYEYASVNISNWHTISEVQRKSTMLALSGILNTMDNEMTHIDGFESSKAACLEDEFASLSPEMKLITDELISAMGPENDIWKLKSFCREHQLNSTKTRCESMVNSD
ncbi:hypothetical protein BGZ80_003912 [Entomortierella chlamydospora]|uniref:Uncharacterized protein n=1 Tax=Entomortierella chlamydospora TaxID=101097 RepID=A0A9P6SWN0_9FUNG|nr:hypothetical protein BGZ80_003912 [Entomortierella chlamydospora]